ncbi:MAG: FHA domain-containing serine/threonine-protein kinase [Phocaeicola sp.]
MKDYSIVKQIGQGGMGAVYEAHTTLGERVALKKLSNRFAGNSEYRELFNSEVAALRKMNSPTVVAIKGDSFSDTDGNLYLPMEYIEGETIEKYINERGALREEEAILLMEKILDAFSYIHRCNCIHRDIKPSNIMLKTDGNICIIDFGIAKDMKMATGKTIGRIIGTDGYMSPEQAKGDSIDSRTDIYSLGCLFYFLLCGKHAIKKESNEYQTICSILNEEFPSVRESNPSISRNTELALLKAVDKNMLNRFRTAEAFKHALRNETMKETKIDPLTKTQLTVGRIGCDINIPNEYVSSQHLIIKYYDNQDPTQGVTCLTIIDNSSNGTSVDGKYLHKDKMTFDRCKLSEKEKLPTIYLAGRTECKLEWDEVIRIITEKNQLHESPREKEVEVAHRPNTPQTQKEVKVQPQKEKEEIKVGVIIFSFLFPLGGWIFWLSSRDKWPKTASKACYAAWISVAISMIIAFFESIT